MYNLTNHSEVYTIKAFGRKITPRLATESSITKSKLTSSFVEIQPK